MSKYKKKYKGVRYIAKALTKYQKGKYKNYTTALPDARKFFNELKTQNKSVKLSNIWGLSRTRRVKQDSQFFIDPKLLNSRPYFDLALYPTYIQRCSNNLYFKSNLFPADYDDIQGGSLVEYTKYFAPFVNYINSMQKQDTDGDNKYETDWLVLCTEPVWNVAKKRFESIIVSVDSNDEEIDYGFDPKKPFKSAERVIVSDSTKDDTKKDEPTDVSDDKDKPTSSDAERVREIRGLIADLREDAKAGLITKEQYQERQKALLDKLQRGGKL